MGGFLRTTRTWVWWVLSLWALIGLAGVGIMLFNLKWDYPDWRFVLAVAAVGRLAVAGVQTAIHDARNARRLSAASKAAAAAARVEAAAARAETPPDRPAR